MGDYVPLEYDFGDAPDPTYPTWNASGGAFHTIVPGFFLGNSVDPELDGQPHPQALGDDNDGNDDEDGVTFTSTIRPGWHATVDVTASAPGHLDLWIDFDGDGGWAEAHDHVFAAMPLNPGVNSLTFNIPTTGNPEIQTFARFRFSSAGGLPYTGGAPDGEIEDYLVDIEADPTAAGEGTPQRFNLYQNNPNPFNPMTTIRFDLPTEQPVRLTIYTVDGRRILTLVNEPRPAGRHEAIWNGRDAQGQPVASGSYFYNSTSFDGSDALPVKGQGTGPKGRLSFQPAPVVCSHICIRRGQQGNAFNFIRI